MELIYYKLTEMQNLILPSLYASYFLCKRKDMLLESYDLSLFVMLSSESLTKVSITLRNYYQFLLILYFIFFYNKLFL